MGGGHLGCGSEIKDWNKLRMKDCDRFMNPLNNSVQILMLSFVLQNISHISTGTWVF